MQLDNVDYWNQRGNGKLRVAVVATPAHIGRTTQVWDAVVTHLQSGRTLALCRCTQMVLYPKAGG